MLAAVAHRSALFPAVPSARLEQASTMAPAGHPGRPKHTRGGLMLVPDQVYPEGELKKPIEATEQGSLDRALVMVPTLTGMRIGEVLGLTWPAVDFKANVINVRLNLVVAKNENGVELKAPKSKKSRRTLDMPRELAHELKLWKLKCPPSEHDLVFTTIAGGFIHRKNAGQIFDQIIERANKERQQQDKVKRLTFHKLRLHVCIVAAIQGQGYYRSEPAFRAL